MSRTSGIHLYPVKQSKTTVNTGWSILHIKWIQSWPAYNGWTKGLERFHACGHHKHHPLIKVLSKPQTPPPFLSPLMWRFTHSRSTYPPFNCYFGPNIAEETICVCENTTYQSHQRPGKQKAGSIGQTLPLVTALPFSRVSHRGWRRGCLLWSISHCKGKENLPPGPFNKLWKQVHHCAVNYNKHRSKGTEWTSVSRCTMWPNFFPYRALALHLPTLINSPLIRTEKCDFHLSLLCFFFLSHPLAPCVVLTQPADPLCPLGGPLQPWEEEAHARATTGGSLAAPTWRLAGVWRERRVWGFYQLAVSSSVTRSRVSTQSNIIHAL